jgi:hypothetical protein
VRHWHIAGVCPGGFQCSEGTAVPVPCAGGSFCPAGSSLPHACIAAYYCPLQSPARLPCSPGSYCPVNSSAPLGCPPLRYCPELSAVPLLCPLGYRTLMEVENNTRAVVDDACSECSPGRFSEVVCLHAQVYGTTGMSILVLVSIVFACDFVYACTSVWGNVHVYIHSRIRIGLQSGLWYNNVG